MGERDGKGVGRDCVDGREMEMSAHAYGRTREKREREKPKSERDNAKRSATFE